MGTSAKSSRVRLRVEAYVLLWGRPVAVESAREEGGPERGKLRPREPTEPRVQMWTETMETTEQIPQEGGGERTIALDPDTEALLRWAGCPFLLAAAVTQMVASQTEGSGATTG
jgi:hypothetical protein